VTFGVIIISLVGQGLMLPFVVQWLGLTKLGKQERKREIKDELVARKAALKEVNKRLEKAIKDHGLPNEAADHLRTRNEGRMQVLPINLIEDLDQMRRTAALKLELIAAERDFIYELLRDGKITDEARRRIEYELDLEEAGVANRGQDGGGWM
jgi:CPA1 family monovalent cation:H+ antiporter